MELFVDLCLSQLKPGPILTNVIISMGKGMDSNAHNVEWLTVKLADDCKDICMIQAKIPQKLDKHTAYKYQNSKYY